MSSLCDTENEKKLTRLFTKHKTKGVDLCNQYYLYCKILTTLVIIRFKSLKV